MKLILPAHETIRIKLFSEQAKVIQEYNVSIKYDQYSIKDDGFPNCTVLFSFSDLKTAILVPKSRIIVLKDKSLPLMFTETSGSTTLGKFKTASVIDSNIKINDRIIKLEKLNLEEKKLSSRLIERSWEEKITRTITIKNETGRKIANLRLEISDNPAKNIVFVESTPKAQEVIPPIHLWLIDLVPDEEYKVTLVVSYQQKEKIEIQIQQPSAKLLNDFAESAEIIQESKK
jgi:hypothetical protein